MTDSAGVPPRADPVLPCPDEAQALPRVPARVPAAWRAVVVDSPEDAERVAASAPATGFAALHAELCAAVR
ncbi:hypothetical protein [Streptomyces sp. NBC_01343]|uniref:hypothetical protein n=1 Tax=Streptomyces sp. NBC_01343 TaxID=2903832 RepID=UPI003FA35132